MKILIADDEPLALIRLQKMIEKECPCEIFTATNGKQAVELATIHHPQIAFLDIQMPVMSGVVAAEKINNRSPETHVVFCTAYDEFAIKAFELSVKDYLLKPVNQDRLSQCLQKLIGINKPDRITFQKGNDIMSLGFNDIYCFISEEKYTFMHCAEGKVIIDDSLVHLEKKYKDQLLRINRNALINKNELIGVHRENAKAFLKLASIDYQPQISRRNLAAVKKILK